MIASASSHFFESRGLEHLSLSVEDGDLLGVPVVTVANLHVSAILRQELYEIHSSRRASQQKRRQTIKITLVDGRPSSNEFLSHLVRPLGIR